MRGAVHESNRRLPRLASVLLIATILLAVPGKRAGAQVLPAAAGAVGGFLAGVILTTGTVVLEARLGKYVYAMDELVALRPEIIPILAGPIVGAVLGAKDPGALGRAGVGAVLGIGGGVMLGVAAGELIWNSSEGRWAGGIIGGAAGMLVGAILNARAGPGDDAGGVTPAASVSIRIPWGKR